MEPIEKADEGKDMCSEKKGIINFQLPDEDVMARSEYLKTAGVKGQKLDSSIVILNGAGEVIRKKYAGAMVYEALHREYIVPDVQKEKRTPK